MSAELQGDSSEAECLPEDKPVPRPEDYIGRTIESEGVPRRVESIEAAGSKFVVFNLRNLKTGKIDNVMKVFREEFDPLLPLVEALPEAMNDLTRNPDRVIRICDRLLAIDAASEAAAFNKGVALLEKNEPGRALEAFDLAVALEPKNVLNLVHRAACLARLQRDDECLRELQAADDVDRDQLKEALVHVFRHAAVIRQALMRLSRTVSKSEEARQALRTHFGPLTQLRLLFARLYF